MNSKKSLFSAPDDQTPSYRRAPILTPLGAAEFLGLDPRTVTRWARNGYLPAHPLGQGKKKSWRFLISELIPWVEDKTNTGRSE